MAVYLPATAILLFFAFHFRRISITRPDLLTSVFIRDYLLFASCGYIYFSNTDNFQSQYILSRLQNDQGLYYAIIAAFYFIVIFILFFNIIRSFSIEIISSVKIKYRNFSLYLDFLTVLSIGIFAVIFYNAIFYDIGLRSILSHDDPRKFAEIRALAAHADGYLRFAKILSATWAPMLSFTWLYLWLNERNNLSNFHKFIFILSMFFGLISSFWTLEKANVAYFIFGLIGVWLYSGRRISISLWIAMITLSISTIAAGYIFTYGDKITGMSYLFDIFIHRFAAQSTGSIVAFTLYPDVLSFKGLSGISNFLASLVGGDFSSAYSDMIDYIHPETSDISGAISSFATGDAYALFGIPGVLISPIIASLYFGFLEATKIGNSSKIIWCPLYANFFSHPYLSTSFYSFFWPIGFVTSIAPFLAIWLVAQLMRERRIA